METISTIRTVAIVGVNEEAAEIFSSLLRSERFQIIKVINPEIEDIQELNFCQNIDIIINATGDPLIDSKLKALPLPHTEIQSGLTAQLLYCTGLNELRNGNIEGYRSKILSGLYEVRRSVYLAKNKEELLRLVLSISIMTLSADSGSIMLADSQKRFLKIEVAKGLEHSIISSTTQKIGLGVAGTVAKSGKPLLIKGKVKKTLSPHDTERTDISSSICSPLIIGNDIVGVLNINSKNPHRIFSEIDVRFLKKLADFTADVIQTSKVYEDCTSSYFSHSLLNQARNILQFSFSFEERLNLLMMKIANTFDGQICNFYRYSKENRLFLVQASSSFTINMPNNKMVKLNDFFTSKILRTKRAFCFYLQLNMHRPRKWYIAHPLMVNDEIIGLLFFHMVSERENVNKEFSTLKSIGSILEHEFKSNQQLQTTQMQSIKYSAISEITFDFNQIHSMHYLARQIVTNACLILEAESSILSLYNSTNDNFEVLDSFSLKGSSKLELVHDMDKLITPKAKENRDAIFIEDLYKNDEKGYKAGPRSVLCMCIRQAGRPIATFSLYDKTSLDLYDKRTFSETDKDVFIKYCLQIARALERFFKMK